MAEETDFKIDWDLPDYPQLPKMFTSAKAAKKRKHREFIMTDEVLDRVVKIPAAAKTGTPAAQQESAAGSNAATGDNTTPGDADAAAAAAAAAPSKAERKRQKLEAKLQASDAGAGATTAAPASADGPNKKHKKPQAAGGDIEVGNAQPDSKKKKKSAKSELQQELSQHMSTTEAGAAAEAAPGQQDGSAAEALPKKSRRNKFKTQEFLQQQVQQQQQGQQQGQQQEHVQIKHQKQEQQQGEAWPQKKQPQPQQQQQQQSDMVSPEQPSSLSKGQLKKLKKAQQQQQVNGVPGKQASAAKASPAAAAGGAAASLKGAGAAGGSKLLQQFKERLQGSRFRQLNETLYTQPGDASFSTMQEQPDMFTQYHEGFQQQVKAWPSQPLDAAISWLKPQPADWVVADFGCGEARLAASVKQTVHSLDLVAAAPGVIACNMAHTPLDTSSCDVAVFSLALMGTDYGAFLVEASRVLKPGGWLWVAEVRSRFADGSSGKEDFRPLLAALKALGFKLVQQDAANRMFVVWVMQKKADGAKLGVASGIKWPTLRACMYKKR